MRTIYHCVDAKITQITRKKIIEVIWILTPSFVAHPSYRIAHLDVAHSHSVVHVRSGMHSIQIRSSLLLRDMLTHCIRLFYSLCIFEHVFKIARVVGDAFTHWSSSDSSHVHVLWFFHSVCKILPSLVLPRSCQTCSAFTRTSCAAQASAISFLFVSICLVSFTTFPSAAPGLDRLAAFTSLSLVVQFAAPPCMCASVICLSIAKMWFVHSPQKS